MGRFGGVLRDVSAAALASTVIRELVSRTGLRGEDVDDVIMGQCYASGEAPAIGRVAALDCVRVDWVKDADGRFAMHQIPGSDFALKADLVLLAMGFLGPRRPGMVEQSGAALDVRGNVRANTLDYRTSVDKLFADGDMRRGQSLVVWAIREGRQCARAIDEFLMGSSLLPR